jgi:RNA polymerase sigma factor (sigma-70 family)
MVYRVCWRVLQQEQDVEDAFQAAFLVLAQKLRSVRKHASLGSWLHGVAHRVALKARARAATRRRHERRQAASLVVPADEVTWRELRLALDAELAQLPDRWRLPLVLCYLEGRTQDEAAGQLSWSKITLRRRLEEAREALAQCLARRGVGPAALAAVLLSDSASPAGLPPGLVASTVEAASRVAAGQAAVASAAVIALAEGVGKTMSLSKVSTALALVLAATLATAAGIAASRALPGPPAARETSGVTVRPVAPSRADNRDRPADALEELKALDKRWRDRGLEYEAATKEETSPQKLDELARRLMPVHDPQFIEEFFELEKRCRGKDVGLFALSFVILRAAQVGDPDMAVVRGRTRALEILREHYLDHEDLDWPLMSLLGGPIPLGAEEMLKTVAEKSTHEHVRAAALYMGAALLKRNADFITARRGIPAQEPESPLERRSLEKDRKLLERLLKSYDDKQARKQAELLAKRVVDEYPDAAFPSRYAEPDAFYMPQRIKAPGAETAKALRFGLLKPPGKAKVPTYADKAKALLFELTHLVGGQEAPPLAGRDSEGKEFRLGDCKGRVVVLMFSANWCAPCKGLYPTLREL